MPSLGYFTYAVLLATVVSSTSAQNLEPVSGALELALGRSHACLLTAAGGVQCWGSNAHGQLGTGDNQTRFTPAQVSGLSSGVVSVSGGERHTCAVISNGNVQCWGDNLLGQLGNGETSSSNIPVPVLAIDDAVEVSVGGVHACALRSNHEVSCWGFNGDAQLGTGDTDNRQQATGVSGLQDITAISAGRSNTCALNSNGAVACWGVVDRICNGFGCSFQSFGRPTAVAGLQSGVRSISAGEYFNCAVTDSRGVKCWGDNYDRQLGVLDTFDPDPLELFDIDGLETSVSHVSAGYDHACATLDDGTVRCWANNGFGQLGDGAREDQYPPVATASLSNAVEVHTGRTSTCALTQEGQVQCWGSNGAGQLGDNDPWFRLTPTPVPGLQSGVQAITAGATHSCALLQNGNVQCWGSNSRGQIGEGGTVRQPVPVNVVGLSSVSQISAGRSHSCAITNGTQALCWGSNEFGQIGVEPLPDQLTPTVVTNYSSGAASVEAGNFHTCASTTDGAAQCWGRNIESQLGDASLATQTAPVQVIDLRSGVTSVSAGGLHACAITDDGSGHCWGSNGDGQIGNNSTDTAFTAVMLDFPVRGASVISAGAEHTCAVVSGGEALCWGENDDGQLGLGFTTLRRLLPQRVQGLASGVTSVSAGDFHTCGLQAGNALCWGENRNGQLGDNSTTSRQGPVAVSGLASGVVQISAGAAHTCALSSAGAVSCWGSNASDQLGLGRRDNRVPAPVLADPALFRSGFESPSSL
ncbi:MAG: hypothetical protein AB8B96_04550 [Lysobacterales bacterium]